VFSFLGRQLRPLTKTDQQMQYLHQKWTWTAVDEHLFQAECDPLEFLCNYAAKKTDAYSYCYVSFQYRLCFKPILSDTVIRNHIFASDFRYDTCKRLKLTRFKRYRTPHHCPRVIKSIIDREGDGLGFCFTSKIVERGWCIRCQSRFYVHLYIICWSI
jgi:hypothetical protein